MPVRWVGQAPFLSKDGESQNVLSEDFGRWLLATCRSWPSHYNLLISESYIDQEKLILFKPGFEIWIQLAKPRRTRAWLNSECREDLLGFVSCRAWMPCCCGTRSIWFCLVAIAVFGWKSGPHAFRVTFSSRRQPPLLPAFLIRCIHWDIKNRTNGCLESTTDSIFSVA